MVQFNQQRARLHESMHRQPGSHQLESAGRIKRPQNECFQITSFLSNLRGNFLKLDMLASFQEIISSRLFKFIVGETIDSVSTEFSVHEEAIAQLSKPLHVLVRGGMLEAQAGCAIWRDVKKETFERLIQFAYTGDYSIPKPVDRSQALANQGSDSHDTVEEPRIEDPGENGYIIELAKDEAPTLNTDYSFAFQLTGSSWGLPGTSKKDRKKARLDTRQTHLLPRQPAANFHSLKFPLLASRNSYHDTCEPDETFEADQSYSNVFLAHASLYVLGDYQLIESLKMLALYKLHKTLCIFQLNDENVEDIIDLARFAYSEEGRGIEEGVGELRSLVCQYMAANAVELSLDAGFMSLLGEGGQFVQDFFRFEVQRI